MDYYFDRDVIHEFGWTLLMKDINSANFLQQVCILRGYRLLENRRLYKCPFEGLIDKFAKVYGYNKVLEEERGFDTYDESISWEEKIKQYFEMTVPMCKYCSEKCEMSQWEVKESPSREDSIVEN